MLYFKTSGAGNTGWVSAAVVHADASTALPGTLAVVGGLGVNGATPAAKAAAPVTLADVIAILQGAGLCS